MTDRQTETERPRERGKFTHTPVHVAVALEQAHEKKAHGGAEEGVKHVSGTRN